MNEVKDTQQRNNDVESAEKAGKGKLGDYGQWEGVEETKEMKKNFFTNSIPSAEHPLLPLKIPF